MLQHFIDTHPHLFVPTGAGCSTASGIPDYRDRDGQWKRTPPVTYAAFMQELPTRRRYCARSLVGWRRFGHARPNAAHHALAALERQGMVDLLVTQNVDGLYQRAGNANVIDLHGRFDTLRCMACDWRGAGHDFQHALIERNPDWAYRDAADAPDGDADLEHHDFASFDAPPCPHCGGIVKPDAVFFGETCRASTWPPRWMPAAAPTRCG